MKNNSTETDRRITRSPGTVAPGGYIVGGGWRGFIQELDIIVMQEAEFLRDHYHANITIRYNSNRLSGGAWLIDSPEDSIGSNCSIGLGASLFNSKLCAMTLEARLNLPLEQFRKMTYEPDSVHYTTCINLEKTENNVPPDSRYILLGTEYREFDTLEEAKAYLISHVFRLKEKKAQKTVWRCYAL